MADRLDLPGTPRLLLDGIGTTELAVSVREALRTRGRQPLLVAAEGFWRPAGERFTHGREDWQEFRDSWLNAGALRREVLDAVMGPKPTWLPALWDVARDRSARLTALPVPDRAVVIVHGVFLLGRELPAELVAHVALSPAALSRRGVPGWQLAAFATYDDQVRPSELCDVLVRAEDPLRPAVRWP